MGDQPDVQPVSVTMTDERLVTHAREVLDANWLGHATSPSVGLYPHQWSWDSAFVAMGYAYTDQVRAQTELRTLFDAQWRNGMVPHIVFVDDATPYFPGPDVWRSENAPNAPAHPLTSGIVQPPVHATAVWHVYQRATDRGQAKEFIADMFPRLTAWHDYLYRERTRDGGTLVELWHPWESGMDNLPLWDAILARIDVMDGTADRTYQRTDLHVANPAERPTDAEYDRYVHLVELFRHHRYDSDQIQRTSPFVVRDVLFNSLLVRANRDLGAIARELGEPDVMFNHRADETAQAVNTELWRDGYGYVDVDVVSGAPLMDQVWSRFSPLFAAIPSPERAARLADEIAVSTVSIDGLGPALPSLAPDDQRFDPTLYWRGPVWINANWLVSQGLRRYGFVRDADALDTTIIELARRGGFSEHYNPLTGHGHGGGEFAWSAALVLDLLHQD